MESHPHLTLHTHLLFESRQKSYFINLKNYYQAYDMAVKAFEALNVQDMDTYEYYVAKINELIKQFNGKEEMPARCIINLGGEYTYGRFTIGLNNQFAAIALYPKEKWAQKCEQLSRIPESDIKGTRYVRLITGNSFSGCELDAQGRVLLPATLRAKVGMDKAIRFVGMGQYLEIWDEERYLGECGVSEESIDDLLDYVNGQYYHAQA